MPKIEGGADRIGLARPSKIWSLFVGQALAVKGSATASVSWSSWGWLPEGSTGLRWVASEREIGFDLVLCEGAEDSGRNEQDRGDRCASPKRDDSRRVGRSRHARQASPTYVPIDVRRTEADTTRIELSPATQPLAQSRATVRVKHGAAAQERAPSTRLVDSALLYQDAANQVPAMESHSRQVSLGQLYGL